MQIGVDACCWSNRRGYGRFTRELLTAVVPMDQKNDYWFFVDKETASSNVFPDEANVVVVPTSVSPTKAASASGHRSFKDLWAMTRAVWRHDLDLFFFPAVYSYFLILNRTKIIVTIHDMTPERHPEEIFPNKKQWVLWKLKKHLAVRQARLILAPSEYSKREILSFYDIPESRVAVISEGPKAVFTRLPRDEQLARTLLRYQLNSSDRFLLYVGGISPHKNLRTLLKAYRMLTKDRLFSDVKLILAGDHKNDPFYSDYPALERLLNELHLGEKVFFTGYVEDKDLACLYNAASLLVFPSLNEGFGLPAVEAMACGTPVAASSAGSLPEIIGEAGRFFDPVSSLQMRDVIKDILSNDRIREEMKSCGLRRAKQFTWDKAAQETISIFNKL